MSKEKKMKYTKLLLLSGCLLMFSACNSTDSTSTSDSTTVDSISFSISSTSYSDNGSIASKYACLASGGSNISPQYSWENASSATTSFAIIMDDEVTPCGTGDSACKHWAVFNIPSTVISIDENQDISEISNATEGMNYTTTNGYAGPCPPQEHIYKTTVYSLNSSMPTINAGTALTRSKFSSTYSDNILESATISGIFTP